MVVGQFLRRGRRGLTLPVLLLCFALSVLYALSSLHPASPYYKGDIGLSDWAEDGFEDDGGLAPEGVWEVDEIDALPVVAPAPPSTPPPAAVKPVSVDPQTAKSEHPIVAGFLQVKDNLPGAPHPIRQLITRAQNEWEAKQKRQSGSLKAAVKEYKLRHGGRNPPKGFDKWWKFVVDNNVQMPDEYDRIMKDLAPFRGLSGATLKTRLKYLQSMKDTFSLSVRKGKLVQHSQTYDTSIDGAKERSQGQFDFLKDVAKDMEDFDAVFSIHDTPTQFVSYSHLMELKTADEEGETFDEDEGDRSFSDWGSACPPGTPLHDAAKKHAADPKNIDATYKDEDETKASDRIFMGWKPFHVDSKKELDVPESHLHGGQKSFVWSQDGMMDICNNPEFVRLHGAMNGLHPVPSSKLLPIFSLSKTNLHSDIMVIPIEQWGEDPGAKAWKDKKIGKLLWRGRNTGGYATNSTPWRSSHRPRIARMASEDLAAPVDIIPPATWVNPGQKKVKDLKLELVQGTLNKNLMDLGLAYEPVQCSVDDGTCKRIKEELQFRDVLTFDQETDYQYILDVDGNAWSARFHRLLLTRAVIVKNSIFPEWFSDRIQPWVHYVPTALDFEDLYDIMTFFRGDGDKFLGEEALAQQIGEAGREWALTFWRREDMTAYMYRLMLEWSRLLSDDRSAHDFILKDA